MPSGVLGGKLSSVDEPEQQQEPADDPLVPEGALADVRQGEALEQEPRADGRDAPVQARLSEREDGEHENPQTEHPVQAPHQPPVVPDEGGHEAPHPDDDRGVTRPEPGLERGKRAAVRCHGPDLLPERCGRVRPRTSGPGLLGLPRTVRGAQPPLLRPRSRRSRAPDAAATALLPSLRSLLNSSWKSLSSSSEASSRAAKVFRASWVLRMSSSSLRWSAVASRFCVAWMRNTIRKVTTVVPVLITSCHESLKWNSGPVTAQAATTSTASANASGVPRE